MFCPFVEQAICFDPCGGNKDGRRVSRGMWNRVSKNSQFSKRNFMQKKSEQNKAAYCFVFH